MKKFFLVVQAPVYPPPLLVVQPVKQHLFLQTKGWHTQNNIVVWRYYTL